MKTRGNVLFLILIAVALFAALSYAVTGSGRSGGNDASDENADLYASQIIQYASLMTNVITRLRLSHSCSDNQISFARDSDGDGNWYDADDDYHNLNSPSNFKCHVFHAEGGGVTNYIIPPEILDSEADVPSTSSLYGNSHVNAVSCISNIGTGNAPNCLSGASNGSSTELIFFVPYIKDSVCEKINNILGVGESSDIPENFNNQQVNDSEPYNFDGRYYTAARFYSNFDGIPSGCYKRTSGTQIIANIFYSVLIAR